MPFENQNYDWRNNNNNNQRKSNNNNYRNNYAKVNRFHNMTLRFSDEKSFVGSDKKYHSENENIKEKSNFLS